MQLNELAARKGDSLDYQKLVFDYARHPDQDAAKPVRRPVVVVGAGPVGLALAIDLAQRQIPVVLLDNDNKLSTGSRAICFAKRTLEIFDRLGCGDRMVAKGVSWNVGKVFFKEEQVYSFDLLPEAGHARPAFINLQQYYVEGYLAERTAQLPLIDLRWQNKVAGVEQHADHVTLTVETPDGPYQLEADYVAACDGGRSAMRQAIGQESKGRIFRDRFLIADVKMNGIAGPQGMSNSPVRRSFRPLSSCCGHAAFGHTLPARAAAALTINHQSLLQEILLEPRVRAASVQ